MHFLSLFIREREKKRRNAADGIQGGIKREKKCMFRDTRREKERQEMHVP
jgi:hypothetical protein